MATYTEDWSGSTLNAEPTGWSKRHTYTASTVAAVQEDALAPSGRRCRVTKTGTERSLLSINAVDSDPDRATFQCRALIRMASGSAISNGSYFGLMGRASGAAGNETGDAILLAHLSGSVSPCLRHNTYVSGSGAVAKSEAGDWAIGALYWLTVSMSGSALVATLAPHNTPETPIVTLENTAAVTAAGWIGLWSFASSNSPIYDYLWLGIGTGADDAPYPVGVLSNPVGVATSGTSAEGTVDVNLSHGTIYAVVTESATQPSATQLKAGQDHTGTAATYIESKAVTAIGEQTFTATGLATGTTYHWHFLHENADSDESNIVTSNSLDTPQVNIRLENDLPFYDDLAQTTLTNDTGVTVTVLTTASPPTVSGVYTNVTIESGLVKITDTPFETVSNTFTMVLRKGTFSRVVDGTVVED